MIDVQTAVINARNSLVTLWGSDTIEDVRVEEVEICEEEQDQFWLITLGFIRQADKVEDHLGDTLSTPRYRRDYKIFKVDGDTGQVQSMKIRKV